MASKKSRERKRSNPEKKKTLLEKKEFKIGILLLVVIIVIAAAAILISGGNDDNQNGNTPVGNPIAVFDTTMGTIKVELNVDKAPITANNFIKHANNGYYNGVIFHRVMPDFMIQGGDPKGDGTGGHAAEYHDGYGNPDIPDTWVIPDEFHEDLRNIRGTISMANAGANTGGSQFFINVKNNAHLDDKHAVFGTVLEGMDVADAISEVDTGNDTKPEVDVVINSIAIENQ